MVIPHFNMLRSVNFISSITVLATYIYIQAAAESATNGELRGTCLKQAINIAAGQISNFTVPSSNCTGAELQFSDGSSTLLSAVPAGCSSPGAQYSFSLSLNNATVEGPLNLTVFCQEAAPVCLTINVQAPTVETSAANHDSMIELCTPSHNLTIPIGNNPTLSQQSGGTTDSGSIPSAAGSATSAQTSSGAPSSVLPSNPISLTAQTTGSAPEGAASSTLTTPLAQNSVPGMQTNPTMGWSSDGGSMSGATSLPISDSNSPTGKATQINGDASNSVSGTSIQSMTISTSPSSPVDSNLGSTSQLSVMAPTAGTVLASGSTSPTASPISVAQSATTCQCPCSCSTSH